MKPYYEDGSVAIYHGDCAEILPTLPKVDLVLTDPPYGINYEYASYEDTRENLQSLINAAIKPCIDSHERVCVLPGITQVFLYPEPNWIGCITWNTTGSFGSFGYTQWMPVLLYGKDVRGFGSVNGELKSDVIRISGGGGVGFMREGDDGHPCPKPLNLMVSLINRLSERGQIILDPFCGSGTTLLAAKNHGRYSFGIEIEERYCEIAANRLRQGVLWGAE